MRWDDAAHRDARLCDLNTRLLLATFLNLSYKDQCTHSGNTFFLEDGNGCNHVPKRALRAGLEGEDAHISHRVSALVDDPIHSRDTWQKETNKKLV